MWPSEARRFWHAGTCAVAAALLADCGSSGDDDGRVLAGDSGAGGHAPGGQSQSGQSGGAPSQGGSAGGAVAGAGAASGSGASTAAGAGASAGAGGAIVTTDDVWKRYSAALCHHYFQCANELFFSEEMEAMVDEAGCAAWLGRSLAANPHLAALDAAVAGGVLQVDGAALDRCVAAIALCNYPIDLEPTAGFAFEALTPPTARGAVGDSCSSHADCESGLCEREHGCVAALCSAR